MCCICVKTPSGPTVPIVLVAEDEKLIRDRARRDLDQIHEDLGVGYVVVSCPEEILKMVDLGMLPPNPTAGYLLVTDQQMPPSKKLGHELVLELAHRLQLRDFRIITGTDRDAKTAMADILEMNGLRDCHARILPKSAYAELGFIIPEMLQTTSKREAWVSNSMGLPTLSSQRQ